MSLESILRSSNLRADSIFALKFIDPEAIISFLNLPKGIVVADFGCGTGYFSLPVAKRIGEKGVVYALDILVEKLEAVESQAKTQGISNVITKRVNLEKEKGSTLREESIDWIILKDMLFQNKDKSRILEEAKRVLKPQGKVLLIEWRKESMTIGPSSELRIPKEGMMELVRRANLGIFSEVDAGNFHYGLILVK
jgi:ubiquinone/menaquinone biosynthesis C-methylase UbiE